MSVFYHITGFENYLKIQKNGLRASADGYIYLLTSKENVAYIAKNQLGYMDSFGVLQIDGKGIVKELEPDDVGEITAFQQRRVKQNLIDAPFISLEGMYKF